MPFRFKYMFLYNCVLSKVKKVSISTKILNYTVDQDFSRSTYLARFLIHVMNDNTGKADMGNKLAD